MITLLLLAATLLSTANLAPAPRETEPSAKDVRGAVEKSLPFLEKSSIAWKSDRKCVTCHQVPFTLWALNEAKLHSLPVDAKKLDELTTFAFEFCTTDKGKDGSPTGGFHLTMAFLTLSQAGTSREDALKAYAMFEPLFAKRQKADGSWREGNQVKVAGAEREADEVDTMWTLLAIASLEKLGDKLPADTRKGLAAEREKALAFLKDAKPGKRIDWLALRALIAKEHGTPAEVQALVKELREQQNADGGWGFIRGGDSYPHTTGECLFALGTLGLTDDPAVKKAQKYLVGTQKPDGSWEAKSRAAFSKDPGKMNPITIHWGTGWATIGLLKTLGK
jgi:hypothetical protein